MQSEPSAYVVQQLVIPSEIYKVLDAYAREEKQPLKTIIVEVLRGFTGLTER